MEVYSANSLLFSWNNMFLNYYYYFFIQDRNYILVYLSIYVCKFFSWKLESRPLLLLPLYKNFVLVEWPSIMLRMRGDHEIISKPWKWLSNGEDHFSVFLFPFCLVSADIMTLDETYINGSLYPSYEIITCMSVTLCKITLIGNFIILSFFSCTWILITFTHYITNMPC